MKTMMTRDEWNVLCSAGRLKGIDPRWPAGLDGLTVETRDGTGLLLVHERLRELGGLYWRVEVKRYGGREMDITLAVEGYCISDLYEETGLQLSQLGAQTDETTTIDRR